MKIWFYLIVKLKISCLLIFLWERKWLNFIVFNHIISSFLLNKLTFIFHLTNKFLQVYSW